MIRLQQPNPFRPAHEAVAALAWALAAFYCACLARAWPWLPERCGALGLAGLCLCLLWRRAQQALRLWRFKLGLAGRPSALLPVQQLERARERLAGRLWLGWGFRWQPCHAQLSQEVLQRDLHDLYPPAWLARLGGVAHDPRAAKGLAWIHGLGVESDIAIPFQALEGHTAVLAITGAIKTVLARLLAALSAAAVRLGHGSPSD